MGKSNSRNRSLGESSARATSSRTQPFLNLMLYSVGNIYTCGAKTHVAAASLKASPCQDEMASSISKKRETRAIRKAFDTNAHCLAPVWPHQNGG